MGTAKSVVQVHPGDLLVMPAGGLLPQFTVHPQCVEADHESEAGFEQPLSQRLLQGPFGAGQVLAEVLQVAAEVEDEVVLLALPRPFICQTSTSTGPP